MIDTINLSTDAPIYPTWIGDLQLGRHDDWTLLRDGKTRVGNRTENRTVAVHKVSKLRLTVTEKRLDRIEVSVPKLLTLDPGIQCRQQSDLEKRLHRLREIVETVAPGIAGRPVKISRLDLALTLDLDPVRLLALHRSARHPRVRRETELYYNPREGRLPSGPVPFVSETPNTVAFNGSHTRISLYNKVAQVCRRRAVVPEQRTGLRAEVQLKGAGRIASAFGKRKGEPLQLGELTLANCYRVFRDLLIQFDPLPSSPAFAFDLPHLIAILNRHPATWTDLGGLQPLDAYREANGVTDRQFRKMSAEVAQIALRLQPFRWQHFLPVDRLPPLVDVLEGGAVQRFAPAAPF